MRIFSIITNRQALDGGTLFGHIPRILWEQWIRPDTHNLVELACRCLLVKTDTATVLVEAGVEFHTDAKTVERFGVRGKPGALHRNLAGFGIDENDIDYVILSHLHFDHVGGVLPPWPAMERPDWRPRFPRAHYVISGAQLGRSSLPELRDRMSFVPGLAEKLHGSDRLIVISSDKDRINDLPEFSFILTHGHSPGVLHTLIKGPDRPLFFTSDIMPGTAWVHLPVTTAYDRCAEDSVREKKALLDRAIKENWLLVYPHDPVYVASGVAIDDKGRYKAIDGVKKIG